MKDPIKQAVRGNYFFYAFAMGCSLPFLPLFFKESLGVSDARLGVLLMIRPAVALAIQPIWSVAADIGGHRARLAIALASAAAFFFVLLPGVPTLTLFVGLYVVWAAFQAPINTLGDAVAFDYLGAHRRTHLANLRVFASFGWITAMLLTGRILDRYGINRLFPVYSLSLLLTIPFLLGIPPSERSSVRQGWHALRHLLGMRNIRFFLAAVLLFETANQMAYAFLSVFSRQLGASHVQVGLVWMVATAAEVVTMVSMRRIIHRIPIKTVLAIGMMLTIFRWIPFGLAKVWWHLLPLQLLHAFTLTFGYIGAATFIDMESPSSIRFTAQAFYSTTVLNTGAMLGSLAGGWLSQTWGYRTLYSVSGFSTLLALTLLLTTVHSPSVQEKT